MKKGIKYGCFLLGVMLLFTFISNAADSFLVAQVITELPSSKKIEHIVECDGVVKKSAEVPILCEEGLLWGPIYVEQGEIVEEGEVLAELSCEQMEEKIASLENEIKILKLQKASKDAEWNAQTAEKKRAYERAKADYEQAVAEKEMKEAQAVKEEQAAADALNAYLEAEREGKLKETKTVEREAEKQQLLAVLQEKQAQKETVEQEELKVLKTAERAVEDASAAMGNDLDFVAEIAKITIEEKQQTLEKLQKIKEQEGKIRAPKKGMIVGVSAVTGQKTTDTAAFTMAADASGVKITANINNSEAAYIQLQDEVTVKKGGREYEEFRVQSMNWQDSESVTVLLASDAYEGDFSMGESVTVKVTKQSELYDMAVLLEAVHSDSEGDFVYVLDEKQTVLGSELFARKVEVTIAEKNSVYAALEPGILSNTDEIIVDCDRYISAGERVRLQEP